MIRVKDLMQYFKQDSEMKIQLCSGDDEWNQFDAIRADSSLWGLIADRNIDYMGVVEGNLRISIERKW